MKITIAYLPEEEQEVDNLKRLLSGILGGAKVKESDRHAPYKHIYMTSKKPETRCGSKGNA